MSRSSSSCEPPKSWRRPRSRSPQGPSPHATITHPYTTPNDPPCSHTVVLCASAVGLDLRRGADSVRLSGSSRRCSGAVSCAVVTGEDQRRSPIRAPVRWPLAAEHVPICDLVSNRSPVESPYARRRSVMLAAATHAGSRTMGAKARPATNSGPAHGRARIRRRRPPERHPVTRNREHLRHRRRFRGTRITHEIPGGRPRPPRRTRGLRAHDGHGRDPRHATDLRARRQGHGAPRRRRWKRS